MGSLIQGRRQSEYDQGYWLFDMREDMPNSPSKMLREGYNSARARAIKVGAAMILTRAKRAGHSIKGMEDIALKLAEDALPKKVAPLYVGNIKTDVGPKRMQQLIKMQEWYRAPKSKGPGVLTKPAPDPKWEDIVVDIATTTKTYRL